MKILRLNFFSLKIEDLSCTNQFRTSFKVLIDLSGFEKIAPLNLNLFLGPCTLPLLPSFGKCHCASFYLETVDWSIIIWKAGWVQQEFDFDFSLFWKSNIFKKYSSIHIKKNSFENWIETGANSMLCILVMMEHKSKLLQHPLNPHFLV